MSTEVDVLARSVARLRGLVEGLGPGELARPSYCAEWDISDVLSHLGSGAVILERRLSDALSGEATPDDFAPSVWERWNAKTPEEKASDALAADAALVERLRAVPEGEQGRVAVPMGPLSLTFGAFAGFRLNEHALHTWDVVVVDDPHAAVAADAVELIVDRLALIARWSGRAEELGDQVVVGTWAPERLVTLRTADGAVSIETGARAGGGPAPDLELPAEALVRLVYGRLDPEHTPPGVEEQGQNVLARLRATFPGP